MPSLSFSDDSCMCGAKIITIGAAMQIVRLNCGEPLEKEVIGEVVRKGATKEAPKEVLYITEWTYDKIDQFLIITFYGSTVNSIKTITK